MKKLISAVLVSLIAIAAYGAIQMKNVTVGNFTFTYPDTLELSSTTMGVFLESDFGFYGQISEDLVNWSSADALLERKEVAKIESWTAGSVSIKAGTHTSDFDGTVNRVYLLTKDKQKALYIAFRWKEDKTVPAELADLMKIPDLTGLADTIVNSVK